MNDIAAPLSAADGPPADAPAEPNAPVPVLAVDDPCAVFSANVEGEVEGKDLELRFCVTQGGSLGSLSSAMVSS